MDAVEALIAAAGRRGVRLTPDYVTKYIAARETLRTKPGDKDARAVVEHFRLLVVSDFGRFCLSLDEYEQFCGSAALAEAAPRECETSGGAQG